MQVVLICTDKPGRGALRAENRDAHLAYARGMGDKVVLAGPLLTADGEGMAGSLFILEVESLAEAEAFAAHDPYAEAGLFESVVIRPWRKVLPQS